VGVPGAARAQARVLLLGLGNDLLTDDAVGLVTARRLQPEFADDPRVDVQETAEMGLALLDFIAGYHAVVIVDSIQTGRKPVGAVHEFEAAGLKRLTGQTPHFLGVGETLALGRELGLPMPARVTILAVEVADPLTLGTQMTPALAQALPAVLARARAALGSHLDI